MKKKTIVLFLGIALLVGLGILTSQLLSKKGKSDDALAAFNFEIKDTAAISKIIITESNGSEIELIRNGNSWADKNGQCIQIQQVNNILDAAYNVRFKGYLPENSIKGVVNRMATVGTKVQYFVNDEWVKTWYIGGSTPDHYGTYMLVESEEAGKSDLPVIAEIKGLKGIIGPRFYSDYRKWACSQIFALEMNQIKKITVDYTQEKERNFEVSKSGFNYKVTSNGKLLPAVDTNLITRYLLNYKRVNFNLPNFELTDRQVDSLKASRPFCRLSVQSTDGKTTNLKMFRRKSDAEQAQKDDSGKLVDYDLNTFWCQLPSGEVVKCQYFVFNPLLMGSIYFNYMKKPIGAAAQR